MTTVQRQTAVTAYLKSKQLLLFVFELQDSLLPSSTGILTAVQRQTAVTAYLKSKQLLLFAFELQDSLLPSSTGIMTAVHRQTAVTAYLKSKQLLLFASEVYAALQSAELFVYKSWRPKFFIQFEIIINVLVSSFCFILIPMLWVHDHYKYFIFWLRGLTLDFRIWRLETVPALQGLKMITVWFWI